MKLLLAIVLLLASAACKGDASTPAPTPTPTPEAKPELIIPAHHLAPGEMPPPMEAPPAPPDAAPAPDARDQAAIQAQLDHLDKIMDEAVASLANAKTPGDRKKAQTLIDSTRRKRDALQSQLQE
ncbi:MAG TPA: hypothetical protein VL463_06340 [Kofleriaceae bacterium]|jgi:hypothetical protein|nr:hypothetical protein [Kofleriaceae bacterium]